MDASRLVGKDRETGNDFAFEGTDFMNASGCSCSGVLLS
jgi:hypothetical protein